MHLDLPTKRYYSIGEIAKAFEVNASLIRFWDKEFEALKPKKNAKGNRRFTPEDVQNLKLIYNLVKERGYTLEGAKTYLKEQDQKSLENFEIITKLERVKNELIKLKLYDLAMDFSKVYYKTKSESYAAGIDFMKEINNY